MKAANQERKPDLKIDQEDLKILFLHTRMAYKNISFKDWCIECNNSYLIYFNNDELYNKRQLTYSQFVNSQIISITSFNI